MSRGQICLAIFFVAAFVFELPAADQIWKKRISSTDQRWRAKDVQASKETRNGEDCVLLDYPTLKTALWPTFIYAPSEKNTDWSIFDYLELDVGYPGDKPEEEPIYINIFHGQNIWGKWSHRHFFKPGRQLVTCKPFGNELIGEQGIVQDLQFVRDRPGSTCSFYFFGVNLVAELSEKKLDKLQDGIDRIRGIVSVTGYEQRLRRLRRQLLQRLSNRQKILWLREYASLAGKLYNPEKTISDHLYKVQKEKLGQKLAGKKFLTGICSGTDKIYPERFFPGAIESSAQIGLARNESEALQVGLYSRRKLKSVSATVKLENAEAHDLIETEVLPLGFVKTIHPSYSVAYYGWTPDPLLTYKKEIDIKPHMWQGFWIDIHAPRDMRPGVYSGEIILSEESEVVKKIPLSITVWNFVLPEKMSFPTAFSVRYTCDEFRALYCPDDKKSWDTYVAWVKGNIEGSELTGKALELRKIMEEARDLFLKHHIEPTNIYRRTPPGADERAYLKDIDVERFNIMQSTNPYGIKPYAGYIPARKKKILDILESYVPILKKEGLYEKAYFYGFDEMTEEYFNSIKDMFGAIKKRYPDLPLMTTTFDYSFGSKTGLADVVDIWVPDVTHYIKHREAVEQARKAGEKIWWYVCGGDGKKATFLLEIPATGWRMLPGLMSWKFDAEGFLYYELMRWRTHQKVNGSYRELPFTEQIKGGPFTNQNGKGWRDTSGDGFFVYPAADGVVPTQRLKCIRDGLEDYEYMRILRDALATSNAPDNLRDSARELLTVPDELVKSNIDFSKEGRDLKLFRWKVAEAICALKAEESK